MLEKFQTMIDGLGFLPFLATVNNKTTLNWGRLVEALIIGLVSAFFISYTSIKEIQKDIQYMNKEITEIKLELKEIDREVDKLRIRREK